MKKAALLGVISSAFWMGSACMMDREITSENNPDDAQWQERGLEPRAESLSGDATEQESEPIDLEDWDEPPASEWGAGADVLGVSGAKLEGELGPVTFDTDRVDVGSYSEPGYTELAAVTTHAEGGAAMAILFFNTDLSHPALQPGAKLHFENGFAEGAEDIFFDVIGCSGPQVGEWEYFDVPADEVDVEVEEDEPGTVILSFHATFQDYGFGYSEPGVDDNYTSGSFRIQR